MFGYGRTEDMGFLGSTFVDKTYLATYVCILLFVILSIILYKTRFGLRLRACGENPQAADSLGITSTKCATPARPYPARWPAWAALSMR